MLRACVACSAAATCSRIETTREIEEIAERAALGPGAGNCFRGLAAYSLDRGQAEVVIGVRVGHVHGGQGLLALEDHRDEAVRVGERELAVDQDRLLVTGDERRVDEEAGGRSGEHRRRELAVGGGDGRAGGDDGERGGDEDAPG